MGVSMALGQRAGRRQDMHKARSCGQPDQPTCWRGRSNDKKIGERALGRGEKSLSRKRYKQMTEAEFKEVAERKWGPVVLMPEARPDWMKAIPEDRLLRVMASGSLSDPLALGDGSSTPNGVAGGFDIFRLDKRDEQLGFPVNKDHYIVITDRRNEGMLLVVGPDKDDDHWLSALAGLGPDVEVLEFQGTVTGEADS